MADISGYLQNIRNGARGEDVRDSIINALDKINKDNPSVIKPLNVTANGTYAGEGGIVYNPITVNVPEGASQALGLVDLKVTENGEFEPDEGQAYRSVTVEVPEYVNEIMPDTKVIEYAGDDSQIYYAYDDGFDGFSAVQVVAAGGGGGSLMTFNVKFMSADGGTLLYEATGVPYGGGAVYRGPALVSSGMRFVGWNPNPLTVKSNMVCRARFENLVYDESQITDDWVTIAKKCQENPDAYSIGQWKLLELPPLPISAQNAVSKACIRNSNNSGLQADFLGNFVKMVLVAKGVDPIEGENGYANTTWVSTTSIDGANTAGCTFYQHLDGTWNWINSRLRAFLQDQFTTTLFPQDLVKYVKRVIKKTAVREVSGSSLIQYSFPSIEWFWIPSARELYGTCSNLPTNVSYIGNLAAALETEGPAYNYFGERVAGTSDYEATTGNRLFLQYGQDPAATNLIPSIVTRSNISNRIFGNDASGIGNQGQNSYGLAVGMAVANANVALGFCI